MGLAGAAAVAWALLGDRARQMRRGRARRCPRCWYRMEGVPGLKCPECGREAKRERGLLKSRRRWRRAAVGAVLIAAGSALHATPGVRERGWISLVPDRALVWMYFQEGPNWEVELELKDRLHEGLVSRRTERGIVTRAIGRSDGLTSSDVFLLVQSRDPRMASALIDAASHGPPEVRASAVNSLSFWTPDGATAQEMRRVFEVAAQDASLEVHTRRDAMRALAHGWPEDAAPLLRGLIDDPVAGHRARVALLEVTRDAIEAEELAKKVASGARGDQLDIIEMYGAMGRHDIREPWAAQFVAERIAAEDGYAIRLAGVEPWDDPAIIVALETLLKEGGSVYATQTAAVAIRSVRGERSYIEGLVQAFEAGDAWTKGWVMHEVMLADLSEAERAAPDLVAIVDAGLRHDDPEVFLWAARAAHTFSDGEQRFGPLIARRRWSLNPQIRDIAGTRMRELSRWWGWEF